MTRWILLQVLIVATFLGQTYARNPSLARPYSEVDLLPFNPHGQNANPHHLQHLIEKHKITTVVEVGVGLGASTADIAYALPIKGKVYAVDQWEGFGGSPVPLAYNQFHSNVIHAQLTHKIFPLKMEGVDAAKHLQEAQVDLVYLNASKDTGFMLEDLYTWYPLVKGHGILCGGDWSLPPVAKAVEIFAEKKGLKVIVHESFWRLREKK